MNKIKILFTIILLGSLSLSNTNATFFNGSKSSNLEKNNKIVIEDKEDTKILLDFYDDVVASTTINIVSNTDKILVTVGDIFISMADYYDGQIPKSYKYIRLNIIGAKNNTELYYSLQKLVYLDLLPNKSSKLNFNKNTSAYNLYKLYEYTFNIKIVSSSQIKGLKSRLANKSDLNYLKKILEKKETQDKKLEISSITNSKIYIQKQEIFNDVYDTIKKSHFNRRTITDIDLIEGATKGLAEGSGDKFTTYFPPVENKDFMESLDGEFEGIGSYVEMEKPGVLKIISPISGSPSEKAGIEGGDIVIKADGKEILDTTSLKEAVSWIKGPKGTPVILTILRDGKILEIEVIRDKIVIKNVESKKINSSTYYIKLTTFGDNISGEFTEALEELNKERGIKKVIFDLRNNPGGYLNEVSNMLGHFVPKGKETAVVKYLDGNQNYYSEGYDLIDFSKYRIIILQNGGSASASEIFVGTLKDYFPNATIIGEQSYGKGSVQTIKQYTDGSSFKYTIAKWFTGKSQTGIDGIGIPVDIELEFDYEEFKKTEIDNQLEKAKNIK